MRDFTNSADFSLVNRRLQALVKEIGKTNLFKNINEIDLDYLNVNNNLCQYLILFH